MCKVAEAGHGATSYEEQIEYPLSSHTPDTNLSKIVYDFASQHLPTAIMNHSLRVFLYASHLSTASQLPSASPTRRPESSERLKDLLFISAMFHDMGTCSLFNGPSRFEICGADAAVSFLQAHAPEIPATEVRDVWAAIACHTSPGIGEEICLLSKFIRLAVMLDFDLSGLRVELGVLALAANLDGRLPRLDIESVLRDAVIKQILEKKEGEERRKKAPENSWPGSLLKGELEKQEGYEQREK